MRSHESAFGRLRAALGTKLNSGHRLTQKRDEFWQMQKIGNQIGHVEERIQANSEAISTNPEGRREQRRECQELGESLANIRYHLEALDKLGAELIQSGSGRRISTMANGSDQQQSKLAIGLGILFPSTFFLLFWAHYIY
jgi:chromosome segregation ATPase